MVIYLVEEVALMMVAVVVVETVEEAVVACRLVGLILRLLGIVRNLVGCEVRTSTLDRLAV